MIRITNSMMSRSFLYSLNNNMNHMNALSTQMYTGKRINNIADDPVGVVKSLQIRGKLNAVGQFTKNVRETRNWLYQTETGLDKINVAIKDVYVATLDACSGTKNQSDKEAIAALVKELRDHIVDLGNSTYGDKYIFGGYNTNKAPFVLESTGVEQPRNDTDWSVLWAAAGNTASDWLDGTVTDADKKIFKDAWRADPANQTDVLKYNGIDLSDRVAIVAAGEDQQDIQFAVGFGMVQSCSFNGPTLLGSGADNVYKTLNDLYNVLMDSSSTNDDIREFVTKTQDAQSYILALTSQVGGRTNRLDMIESRYDDDTLNYLEMQSNIEDADEAEVIMNFKMAEAVYRAALEAGAKIIQPSLMDYLR